MIRLRHALATVWGSPRQTCAQSYNPTLVSAPTLPPPPDTAHSQSPAPPETLEGWFVLHQSFVLDRAAVRRSSLGTRAAAFAEAGGVLHEMERPGGDGGDGWSVAVQLAGNSADLMVLHFRRTLDALGAAERAVKALALSEWLRLDRSFLSVTEAGLYHLTAKLAREARERGGEPGDDEYRRKLDLQRQAELRSDHVKRRLYPVRPDEGSWVCFYPMSKRRAVGQNWYELDLDERSRLMYAHGMTGRRYAGRVRQVITGAIGLDDWEWGVTLFADDPLVFKRIVTEMRFDEVSARYAEFGSFEVGRVMRVRELLTSLVG